MEKSLEIRRSTRRRRATLVAALAVLLFAPASPRATSFTVFGPRTLTRTTGAPNIFDFAFSVPNPSLLYTLQIENDGVASAIVSVNGRQVVGPSDFNPHVEVIQRTVGVGASNALHVELRSKPGTHLIIQIFGKDETPPTITATATPAPNAAGWNRTDVQVSFACSDAGSGIASCSPSKVVSTEGKGQIVTGTAVDNAGNTATAKVTLNIDKKPPTIAATADRIPNDDGWINGDVNVTFQCADDRSGIATCPPPMTVSTDGVSEFPHLTAVDQAGNVGETSLSVNVDKTAPAITATLDPAPNTIGWNNSDVTVTFTCTDAASGIALCPAPVTVSSDGANQPISGTARDRAGNTKSTSVTVSVDKTAPSIAASASPPANTHGWNKTDVVVSFECSDAGSGVVACPDPVTTSSEGGNQSVSRTVADKAGNNATASVTLNIDKSPPTIAADALPPPNDAGWNNTDLTVTFTCQDGLAGVDSCPSAVPVTTEGANRVVGGTATDLAGNQAARQVTVNLDKTLPIVSVASPQPGVTLRTSPTSLSGNVSDLLSGIVSATCNGTLVSPGAGGLVSCGPALVNGPNTLSIAATDAAGNVATAPVDVSYQANRSPIGGPGGPYTGLVGEPVTFTATGTDPDDDPVTFTWNFGDGPVPGQTTTHTYASAGNYSVDLVLADDHGGTMTGTAQVTIAPAVQPNHPPVADAGGSYAGDVGQDIAFSGSGSSDPDGDDLTYSWNFGDGGTGTGKLPTHIFVAAGTYTVTLTVEDGRGGSSSASAQASVNAVGTPTANRGMVRGEVYDDSKGLPLAGATVTLIAEGGSPIVPGSAEASPSIVTADARGQFTLPAKEGDAIIRIGKTGFTTVERRASIPSSTAITALDARLTPLDARTNQVEPALNHVARNAAGDVTLALPPGSVATIVSLHVTSLSSQGLEGRLPYGWSPAAAVDLDPPGVVFQQTTQLSVPNRANLPAASPVVVALYDPIQHRWTAIAPGLVSADGRTLTCALDTSGHVAFVLADDPPFTPPLPVVGQPLAGVAAVAVGSSDTAAGTVGPRAAPPGDNARAIGTIELHPAAPRPSGTVLQAFVTERYNLFDSSPVVPLSFTQDIVLYARPASRHGAALSASFPITPSIAFSIQQLEHGVVALDVTPPVLETGGSIVGPTGGTATDASGNFVQIPAGAVATETIVQIAAVTPERIAVTLPAGFERLSALQLNLGGQSLSQSATLSIPRPPALADTAQVLVAEVISDPRGVRRLRIAGVGRIASGRVALQTTLNALQALTFPGVTRGGQYLFLKTPAPLGFIAGSVFATGGAPQSLALVTADNAPFADVTGAAGAYIVAGAINAASHITAVAPASTITGTTTLSAINQVAQLDLTLDAVALTVVSTSPAANAGQVPLNSPVVVQFSEPLDATTATTSNIALQTGGSPVPGSITLSPDRRIATFLSTLELHSNAVYSLALLPPLGGDSGTQLAPFTPITFTTVDTSKSPVTLGQITADLPDADGLVLIFGTSGTSEPNLGVTASNLRTQETVTAMATTDGSFRLRLPAAIGDEISVTLRDTHGRDVTVAITQFVGADGTTAIGRAGGTIAGPAGRIGTVRPRALGAAATFKISGLLDPAAFPSLPADFTYADRFTLSFQGGPFNQIRSLALTESQNRFAASVMTSAPFESTGSLVVPADFLVNGTVKFSATAEDTGGNRNAASGSTEVVVADPSSASIETTFDTTFPAIFLIAPKQAVPSQQIGVTAVAPVARVDFDLSAPAGLDAGKPVLLTRATHIGTERKLAIVDQFAAADSGGVQRLKTAGRLLSGAAAGGHYGVVVSSVPLAFVSGQLAGPARTIAVDGSPFVVETNGPNARFLVPVAANKPFVLNFIDPSNGQIAATASGQAPPAGVVALNQTIGATGAPLSVTAVPDAGSLVDINEPVIFTFSEPIDRRTLAGNVLVTDAAGIETFGHFRVSTDALRVTFVPNRRWRFGATYRYTVSPRVVTMSGGSLPQHFSGSFTTFAPKLLGSLSAGSIRDVAASGNTLIAGGASGLTVVDVTQPDAPVQLVQLAQGAAVTMSGARGLTAFRSDTTGAQVQIYDLNNPASPSLTRSAQLSAPGSPGTPNGIVLASDHSALAAVQSIGVASIDLDTGTVGPRYPASGVDGANHVAVAGNKALVAGVSGLTILDRATLNRLGGIATGGNAQGVAGQNAFHMDLNGDGMIDPASEIFDLAVVANGSDGTLQFFNVSDGASPRLVSVVRLAGDANSVVLDPSENLAYAGNGSRGIAIVDLAGPASIQPIDLDRNSVDDRVLGAVLTRASAGRLALSLARGIAYVADGPAGLAVVQIVPPRTRFTSILRDPLIGLSGEEESIGVTRQAFTTDDAVRVAIDAAIPPQSGLVLSVEETADAGGPKLLSLSAGGLSTPLVSGANTAVIRLAKNVTSQGSHALLTIRDRSNRIIDRFDFRLVAPGQGAATVTGLFFAPATSVIPATDSTVQLAVGGRMSDGRILNLTSSAAGTTYIADNASVATVDADGLATAVAGGITGVFAFNGQATANGQVTVDHLPSIAGIMTPKKFLTLTALGQQQRLSVIGRFSNGTFASIRTGFGTTYVSSDPGVITVADDGTITAVGPGGASVTITNGSFSETVLVTVEPRIQPNVTGIDLDPVTALVTTDRGELQARARIAGTGSLEGLTVTFSVAGPVQTEALAVTDYSGVAIATVTGLVVAGPRTMSATVVDPTSSSTRSDTEAFVVERGSGDDEPNNDTASASRLETGKSVAGTISATDTRDVYRLEFKTDGTLTVDVGVIGTAAPSDISLIALSSAGSELQRVALTGTSGRIAQSVAAGASFVAVETAGTAASYTITASFSPAHVTIASVVPPSGTPGTQVTIAGSGFSLDAARNIVLFGTVAGKIVSANSNELQVIVPANAVDAALRVLVGTQQANGPPFQTGVTGPPPAPIMLPPKPNTLRFDPITGNVVDISRFSVYFDATAERAQVETLATSIGARIAGFVPMFNTYTLELLNPTSLPALEAVRRQVESHPTVVLTVHSAVARPAQAAASGPVGQIAYDRAHIFDAIELIRRTKEFQNAGAFPPVKIAVIDTGFNPLLLQREFVDKDGDRVVNLFEFDAATGTIVPATTYKDPDGHGTEVTSAIAAVNSASGPLTGTFEGLWRPDEKPFKVMVYRVAADDGSLQTDAIRAALADIANRNDIDVVNISFGQDFSSPGTDFQNSRTAWQLALMPLEPRTLVVTAAGNSGVDAQLNLPAALAAVLTNVMSVAASGVTRLTDGRVVTSTPLEFADGFAGTFCPGASRAFEESNCGPTVTLAAPGQAVAVATTNRAGYDLGSGTSFASPLVAGVAGLLQVIRRDLANQTSFVAAGAPYAPSFLKDLLTRTANDITSTWGAGSMKRLDALGAVQALLLPPRNQVIYVVDQDGDNGLGNPPGKLITLEIDPLTGARVSTAPDREIPLAFTRSGLVSFESMKPTSIAISPTGDEAYVMVESFDRALNDADPDLGDGLLVVDTRSMQAREFIPLCGFSLLLDACPPGTTAIKQATARPGIVFSPDGRLAYVAKGKRIAVINTVTHKIVQAVRDLPKPYNALASQVAIDPIRPNLDRLEQAITDGFPDPSQPSGKRAGTFISSLAISPDGRTLYVAMESGLGGGHQPGALIPINVNLYADKQPDTPGLQSDLDHYLELALPATFMTMPAPGSFFGGDEPSGVAVSPDGKQVYLVNGGLNYFKSVSPEPPDIGLYQNLLNAALLGQATSLLAPTFPGLDSSGGVPGILTHLVNFIPGGSAASSIFNLANFAAGAAQAFLGVLSQARSAVENMLNTGVTFVSAPGYTGVFEAVDPPPSLAPGPPPASQVHQFPADVVFGWNVTGDSLLINQFADKQVFASRPFGMTIRPDGKRALMPLFQSGNFGILDVEAQEKFRDTPPVAHPNAIFGSLSQLPGTKNMFHGVVAVTPALRLNNHLWPERGSFAVADPHNTGRTFMLASPDENLLYTWQAQYAQNGRFAVASHTGTGRIPGSVEWIVPDFVNDIRVRLDMQDLGYTIQGPTATDPQGNVLTVGQTATSQRFGGAISIIDDKKISNDFAAHVATNETTTGVRNRERAYYSLLPACDGLFSPVIPVCIGEVATRIFDYSTQQTPQGHFRRPRGVAVQPFVTFETPRHGDHAAAGDSVQIKWRDSRVGIFNFFVYDLDQLDPSTGDPRQVGLLADAMNADELKEMSLKVEFGPLFGPSSPPVDGHRYRIETRVIAVGGAQPEELSRTSIDVRFEGVVTPPVADTLHLRPWVIAGATIPLSKQLQVLLEPGDGSAPNGVNVSADPETSYAWIGNGLVAGFDGVPNVFDIAQTLTSKLIAAGTGVTVSVAQISVSASGALTVTTPGIQMIRARHKDIDSNYAIVLAGFKLKEIALKPESLATQLTRRVGSLVGGVNPPLLLVTHGNGWAAEQGVVYLDDATFQYLGSATISMNDLVDAIKPVVQKVLTSALAGATGPAAPFLASALTRLVGPGISAVGTQLLDPLESSGPSIVTVSSSVPMKGIVRSGTPGVAAITGTLDLGDLGAASDSVMTWVLPDLETAVIEPEITVINLADPAVPGPSVRTFATTHFGSTATPIPLPGTIATVTEFLDRLLPGGVSTWATGTIDKTIGTDPRIRLKGKFTVSASDVSFSDLTLGFHVPNNVAGITNTYTISEPSVAALGTVEPQQTHIVHQGIDGRTPISVTVAMTGMGSASGDGSIVVCACPGPFTSKRTNLGDTWAIDPGDDVTFKILVANPTGAALENITVTDESFFTDATTGIEVPLETRTFPIARLEANSAVEIDVVITAPSADGVVRNIVHATLPCSGCPPPPFESESKVVITEPGVLINEIVAEPKRDWNDSAGGNGVPFDLIPGTGVIDGMDQWIEIANTGPTQVFVGWTLTLIDMAGATTVIPIGAPVLPSGGFIVVPSPVDLLTIATVQLKNLVGVIRDSVPLATVRAALGPATGVADESISRSPNGLNTGAITDFKKKAATISAVNPF